MKKWKDTYDLVIGLEIHVQLDLFSKAFAPESNAAEAPANTLISPVSLALPGTLPVLNNSYLDAAIRLGLAFGSEIQEACFFDRKHYFYADLPKGYQITQDGAPFCKGGNILTFIDGRIRPVRLDHIHMEEDAGKSIHDLDPDHTLLDFNRAGTPLLEIVTTPDLKSPEEVSACIDAVQQMVQYLGISSANMEKGMLRCDCNVSLKPKGSDTLGTRCEIKNLNSKRHARKAIETEVHRQIAILDAGGEIEAMTMSYDAKSNKNLPIRDKETVHDYRYFPEPDLPVFYISKETIERNRRALPELPARYFGKFNEEFDLDPDQAVLFTNSLAEATFVSGFLSWGPDPKFLANIYVQKIRPWLAEKGWKTMLVKEKKPAIVKYCNLVENGQISASSGLQELLPAILENAAADVDELARKLGLLISADTGSMESDIHSLLTDFPAKVKAYQGGKKGLIGFFMGELMRRSSKKPDPVIAKSILEKMLSR